LAEFVPSDGPAPDGEEVAMTCTGCGQRFAILMDDLRNTADGVVGGAGSILEDREGLAKGFMPVRMGNPRKLLRWESIDDGEGYEFRAKVHGGWIVKTFERVSHMFDGGMKFGWDWRHAMVFVPDSKHEWEVGSE
jgi:hypothetical protein